MTHECKRMKLSAEDLLEKDQTLISNHQDKHSVNSGDSMQDKQNGILKDCKEEVVLFEDEANATTAAETMGQEENDRIEGVEFDDLDLFRCNEEYNAKSIHPLTELKKLVESDVILNRQLAARNVLDTLYEVASNEDDLHTLVSLICKLSNDSEYVVRVEMVALLPQIAAFCREHPSDLESVIRQQLVPLTVKHLTDIQNQVRKTSQVSLLALLEKELVDDRQLTEWICPLVIQLSGSKMDDIKIEGVTLMCKMAPLVGMEITLQFFLEHFAAFCVDTVFGVRQVCSMSFGDICRVVGTVPTEDVLLQKFLSLCDDNVWGVRKNCAEVFVDVSSVVTCVTRKEVLPNVFVNLLCDESRWVRLAAYHCLGAVIATFADPSKTGLKFCEDRTVNEIAEVDDSVVAEEESNVQSDSCKADNESTNSQISYSENLPCSSNFDQTNGPSTNGDPEISSESESNLQRTSLYRTANVCETDVPPNCYAVASTVVCSVAGGVKSNKESTVQRDCIADEEMSDQQLVKAGSDAVTASSHPHRVGDSKHIESDSTSQRSVRTQPSSRSRKDSSSDSPLTVVAKDGHLHLHVENEGDFNNFQYWRVPIPDLELDIDIQGGKTTSIHIRAKVHDEKTDKICASDLSVKISPKEESSGDSTYVGSSQNSLTSSEKLDIQTACMNTVMEDSPLEGGRADGGRISVVNSSFSETSVVLKEGELAEVNNEQNRFSLDDYDHIFESRCLSGFGDKPLVDRVKSPYEQDIVPPALLEYYIGMVDSIQSQTVDTEITRHCAYCFPAVVYTLGRKNWPCVKQLCDALAKDLQWKVRKIVASCLHELGNMLGTEITAKDLFPVFVSFLKDLDEVRIGALSHLHEFLRLLRPSERREFLPLILEFNKTDNERNWRYRYTLAQNLGPIVDLFSPSDVEEHIVPTTMWLITDKVSEVRQAAVRLVVDILRRLSYDVAVQRAKNFIQELDSKLCRVPKWHCRQMYAYICEEAAVARSFPRDLFVKGVLPPLFALAWDCVPNVRIAMARCFALTVLPSDYFPSIQRTHYDSLLQVMYCLQKDTDRDVQYFARLAATAFTVVPPKEKEVEA